MNMFERFLNNFHHEESALSQETKDLIQHMEDEITTADARTEAKIAELWRAINGPPCC